MLGNGRDVGAAIDVWVEIGGGCLSAIWGGLQPGKAAILQRMTQRDISDISSVQGRTGVRLWVGLQTT